MEGVGGEKGLELYGFLKMEEEEDDDGGEQERVTCCRIDFEDAHCVSVLFSSVCE